MKHHAVSSYHTILVFWVELRWVERKYRSSRSAVAYNYRTFDIRFCVITVSNESHHPCLGVKFGAISFPNLGDAMRKTMHPKTLKWLLRCSAISPYFVPTCGVPQLSTVSSLPPFPLRLRLNPCAVSAIRGIDKPNFDRQILRNHMYTWLHASTDAWDDHIRRQ